MDALTSGTEIVVGTPGRIADHIQRAISSSETLVGILDEADEMLSMGFHQEVLAILRNLPAEKQMLLFSATINDQLRQLIGSIL